MTLLRKMTHLSLLAAASLAVVACGPSFELATPPGFVEIDQSWDNYDYRAHHRQGPGDRGPRDRARARGRRRFWLEAIEDRMRNRGGYALLDKVPVKSADGVDGTQLRFGHDEDGNRPTSTT